MRLRDKVIGLAAIVGVAAAALAYREFQSARIAAVHSDAKLVLVTFERFYPLDPLRDHWQIFRDAENEQLWQLMKENADALTEPRPKGHMQIADFRDIWGDNFQIAGRRTGDGKSEFLVWSKGPDGVSGTEDDIIVPESRSSELKAVLESERSIQNDATH